MSKISPQERYRQSLIKYAIKYGVARAAARAVLPVCVAPVIRIITAGYCSEYSTVRGVTRSSYTFIVSRSIVMPSVAARSFVSGRSRLYQC